MLNRVTITGIDDDTKMSDIVSISKKYPFVEWGLLWSKSNGRPRYPVNETVSSFFNEIFDDEDCSCSTSLHVCGSFVDDLVNGHFDILPSDINYFQRVQLNFNNEVKKYCVDDLAKLKDSLYRNFGLNVIFQYNENNKQIIKELLEENNYFFELDSFNILQDSSGGKGLFNNEWFPSFSRDYSYEDDDGITHYTSDDIYTGYAGGLNPDNVEKELNHICKINFNNFWIDVETGVRTDNKLDFNKIVNFLFKSKAFIKYK